MSKFIKKHLESITAEQIPEPLLKWWEALRPIQWDINQHLKNPTVNCKTDREKELALYVADILKRVKCPIPLSEWPEWANWAAMDINESWYFYEYEPEMRKNVWSKMFYESSIFKGSDFPWFETLTHRSELENQKI